jgi:hypothetical protein
VKALRQVYAGSESRCSEGLETIAKGADALARMIGAGPQAVREALVHSGALADPRSHEQIFHMAQSLIKRAG